MYTMKETCEQVGMSYETLRFYCNEGLVPNVKRDKNNYRLFDERNVAWLESLQCLRKCGLSISAMKDYMNLCLLGVKTIPQRKDMLAKQREILQLQLEELNGCVDYIDHKQTLYDGIMRGEIPYTSNLIDVDGAE